MKATLEKRLKQLEQVRAAELQSAKYQEQEQDGRVAIEKMRAWLDAQGAVQQPHESLAEAVARRPRSLVGRGILATQTRAVRSCH